MRTIKKLNHLLIYSGLLIAASSAQAQLRFEISGVGSNQIPISIASFADENTAPAALSDIIRADLQRSGMFKMVDAGATLSDTSAVDYAQWKSRGADDLVVGGVQRLADGRFDIRYRLLDTVKAGQLSGFQQTTAAQFTRLAAHKIADDIYQKLTGFPGAFSTRIAYVTQSGREYRLEVADADGEGIQVALRSNEPIISPSWSPDGTKVAYVSFEKRKPIVYVQNLVTRARTIIANEKGSNSAPTWSPDGSRLAVALSRDGHTQVYIVNADGSGLHRISNSNGIDTEPQFAADGQTVYFTSDRSGGPQIYKMNVNGGEAKRVTFGGNYNISPRISADGKTLAYISRRDGNFQLYALDLASGQEQRLSNTNNDESPSFAPNGKYIMYATNNGGRKSLAVVSVDGRVKQSLTTQAGNIKEPTWGPFMK
ncbi:MAG TPA: Tol-Pal system beta propeller repeat protein TolB [Janthinobacterium sp.]|jgi:TolB protein|nr:Tol-Pal system beta propeller repeat protein TolB [Janthinobacterium sp.]